MIVLQVTEVYCLSRKLDFGWKAVNKYFQHKLANTEEEAKWIRRAEARVEKALKSSVSKKAFKQSPDAS